MIANYPALKKEADRRKMYSYFNTLDAIILSEDYKNKDYFSRIKRYFNKNAYKLIINNTISLSRKIRLLIMFLNITIYKVILRKHHKNIMGK